MMSFTSNAKWPHLVYGGIDGKGITTDYHDTRGQAEAVCRTLERDGFGGQCVDFPIQTWVEQSE
jgi:hypothetical protein